MSTETNKTLISKIKKAIKDGGDVTYLNEKITAVRASKENPKDDRICEIKTDNNDNYRVVKAHHIVIGGRS